MSRSGIVNVRMVITEEKILSNIEKVQKLINPNSKKQIVQLEEDTYFKDLIESVKTYLIEYPKKKNFPASVYKAAYGLVEYATNQFEENTKKIEELIRQREQNISLAGDLKDLIEVVEEKEKNWKEQVKNAEGSMPEDIIETLNIVEPSGRPAGTSNLNLIFVIYLIALPTLLFLIFCHNVGFASNVVSCIYCSCAASCPWTVSASWTATSSTIFCSTSSTGVGIDLSASATSIPI